MITPTRLKKIILTNNLLKKSGFEQAVKLSKKEKIPLLTYIMDHNLIDEAELYKAIGISNKIPYQNLSGRFIKKEVLSLIPEKLAEKHKIIAFEQDKNTLRLVTTEAADLQTLEFIKRKTKKNLEVFFTSPSVFDGLLKQYHKELKAEIEEITDDEASHEEKLSRELPIVKIVNTLLEQAVFERASDIHIEPLEKEVVIRYRVDGMLKNVTRFPKTALPGIVARIKVLSDLKLDEHRLPQDGRFKINNDKFKIAFRVSIIPTIVGEKVVMRLLEEKGKQFTLDQLGLEPNVLVKVKNQINKPYGLILATGPTGSGKTTSLYAILNILNKPTVNIITIEDPIEYRTPGIAQSQVNSKIGYTFSKALRAFLRQDPDIIMVGEIRDSETAEIAIHAALTGHLMLSTLHTNDAVAALPRLSEMGVPPFLIAGTANVIIAQRLVRKICTHCTTDYKLRPESVLELEKIVSADRLISLLKAQKLTDKDSLTDINFHRGKGCSQCQNGGFIGRQGIYEVLVVTPEISELIIGQASKKELRTKAVEQGMTSLVEDGLIKAVRGVTTIEEVLRVSKE